MTEIHVTEKHSVSTVGPDDAEVKIEITARFLYKFVRSVEDEIYKFVENLKRIDGCAPGFANASYSEEEIVVVHGSTRENVWERYQEAFPKSRRTRVGVISYFKKWTQFRKLTESLQELPKKMSGSVKALVPEKDTPVGKPPKLNGWQRKFIIKHADNEEVVERFRKKWPSIKITQEMIRAVVAEGPLVKVEKPTKMIAALKSQIDEIVKNGESKFKIEDRVIQIGGFSPAYGIGVVKNMRQDGVITVKFASSTKVLHADNFARATTEVAPDADNNH